MSTSRPFAYNTGSSITGTEQVGNLAVGTPTEGFSSTGLKWWNGPDEDLGYVIAHQTPSGRPGADGETAYVGFWRSSALTDESFISLSETIAGQSFTGTTEAKTWLNDNGYWTSYVGGGTPLPSIGIYLLYAEYTPANGDGSITFPNHINETYSVNPNLVGTDGYAIYINGKNQAGDSQAAVLGNLIGNSGTLTLTQGAKSVTYSFTSNAFSTGSPANQYYWDNAMEGSPLNALTVISPSSGNFLQYEDITITITIN